MNINDIYHTTQEQNMHTAHWSAKTFPQADVFSLCETYNLSDLAPLGCAFQEQTKKIKKKKNVH